MGSTDTLKTPIQTARWIKSLMDRLDAIVGESVAGGAAFLCSEAGRFISACELPYLFRGS